MTMDTSIESESSTALLTGHLASDECFRLMVEVVQDYAIFMLYPDGRVASWNVGAQRLKGYQADEIIDRHFSCFYLAEDIAAGLPARQLAVASAATRCETEGWRVRKDGTRFWAIVVITAVRDASGSLIGYSKITREVPDRHRAAEQFRLIIDSAPTGMLLVDHGGALVLVNAQIERLFGYGRGELIGRGVEILIPGGFGAGDPASWTAFADAPGGRPAGGGRDLVGRRKDGVEVPVEIGLTPLRTHDGEFVLGAVIDITERKRAERERDGLLDQLQALNADLEARVKVRTAQLSATLKEREVLLQEVHHRVKNNLQVISSLINMQVRQLTDPSSQAALKECQNRVQAIALIHEKLYQAKDYANVLFSDYARSLAANIFHATGLSSSAITPTVDVVDIALGLDKAIPCGLLLNELISNALKHGFPNNRPGVIRVALHTTGSGAGAELVLSVSDDGIGLPPNFDPSKSASLGMQLVVTLAQQLGGRLEVVSNDETTFRVTFPADEDARA
jgi:PAS domain S-box-containing protein